MIGKAFMFDIHVLTVTTFERGAPPLRYLALQWQRGHETAHRSAVRAETSSEAMDNGVKQTYEFNTFYSRRSRLFQAESRGWAAKPLTFSLLQFYLTSSESEKVIGAAAIDLAQHEGAGNGSYGPEYTLKLTAGEPASCVRSVDIRALTPLQRPAAGKQSWFTAYAVGAWTPPALVQ